MATVIQKVFLYFTDEETGPVMGVEANNNTWYLQLLLLLACLPSGEPSQWEGKMSSDILIGML